MTRLARYLLLFAFFFFPATSLPTDARAATLTATSSRVPLLSPTDNAELLSPKVEQVAAVGMTVSDMEASVSFYAERTGSGDDLLRWHFLRPAKTFQRGGKYS